MPDDIDTLAGDTPTVETTVAFTDVVATPVIIGGAGPAGPTGPTGPAGPVGPSDTRVTHCRQTAQATNSVLAVYTEIPGMAFNVTPGDYLVEWFGIYSSSVTTTGIIFSALAPTLDPNTDMWTCNIQQGTNGTDQMWNATSNTFGTALGNNAVAAIDTPYWFKLEGLFTPTAAGVIQLRFRTEEDTRAVTVLNAGHGRLTRWD